MAIKAKELMVTVPDTVSTGAKILRSIANAKINMLAFCGYSMEGKAFLTMVVGKGKEAEAKKVLKKAGYSVITNDVLLVEIGHKTGALAVVTEKLAAANINIPYAYASAIGKRSLVVLGVANTGKALKALK